MYETILVPTDGSAAAEAAVDAGLALAERFGASLHAVHVLELDRLPGDIDADTRAALETDVASVLQTIADRGAERDVTVHTEILETGEPVHRAVADAVRDREADLLVMGTHGRTGLHQFVLGSVTEHTLRISPAPVLTVHEGTAFDPELDTILVPTDGSETAEAAADHAVTLAADLDAALHVVHVVDITGIWGEIDSAAVLDALEAEGKRAVESVVDRAEAAGVRSVEASVMSGTPARSIIEYADVRDVDFVVIGTHGRTGLDRHLLGSVAEKVVRVTEPPVLTVSLPDQD
ncbi:universal stress protein [Halosimplex salinum]|uniref:universal stress protein n=1 Tax=Halosimplex salinum TaxID=1710538 RepID=UPI000F4794D1|nr:universal stress protein [Halosimplex salinum]